MYRSKFGLGRLKVRRWQAYAVAGVAVVVVGAGLGIASAGETVPTVNCPQVAVNVAVPAQQRADVQNNLKLLNTQIDEANQRLRTTVGQGGPNFIQNAILGPLKDKRFATINRIETAIGRNAPKPDLNAEGLSACTLNKNGRASKKQNTTLSAAATAAQPVPTVSCPTVRITVAVPAQQKADVDRNLALLKTQIGEANQRLRTTVGQGGPNFIQNAILGPLKDKRFATINRIETAIGRNAPKPDLNAEGLSACTLNKAPTPAESKSPAVKASVTAAPTTRAPAPAPPKANAPAGSPVTVNGQLSVCGVRLCNQSGTAIQLRGMSSHGLQFFPNCVNPDSLAALRNDWKADFIRLSMYVQEGGLASDPTGFTNKVNGLVDDATALGLYVIVDFHILTPGDPNFNLGLAKTFFENVTAKHAAKNNVLYEIANEPNGVSWDAIKSYADQVIPVIRKNSPNSVVLVGTRGFSSLGLTDGSDEKEILADPVDFKNVMYTFHFYAASHGADRRAVVARAATKLPLFVSEFGSQTFTGDGTNDFTSTTAWLDLLKANKISYGMWSFSDGRESNSVFKQGTCAGTTFAGTNVLTEAGRYLRSRILTGVGNPN
ncbi:glycoside hydrolase family 5 protein [Actinoplanes sp. ATCC 53533]|uniref:glycoside hydrolase family 5 protein n=1 Tax=Actinoplanes sp. ATCC 53533 TaxID=1288362 RepID=UPI0018F78CD7|nr:glycoside hydrolase family 5 protein [Actinoplanes sp. ATCC 53533]